MGVRLCVADEAGELDAVETTTEDDFMFFRDSVHLALEGGKLASRFPILFKTFFTDWQKEDVPELERELREIHAAFRQLPPAPPDANWRARLRSGRTPETLAEVYVDRNGAPLLERLIALAQTARQKGLPIRWGEADSAATPEPASSADSPKEEPSQLSRGNELLLAAVKAGELDAARAALAAGASPNATAIERDEVAGSSATPALYAAVTQGDAAMVELLLSNGADPNAVFERRGIVDFETRPCLIAALPHADIASMLLQAGADPNLPGTWGEDRTTETSPLAHAQGNPALEALLRSYGARETAAWVAVMDGRWLQARRGMIEARIRDLDSFGAALEHSQHRNWFWPAYGLLGDATLSLRQAILACMEAGGESSNLDAARRHADEAALQLSMLAEDATQWMGERVLAKVRSQLHPSRLAALRSCGPEGMWDELLNVYDTVFEQIRLAHIYLATDDMDR